jgi:hypothetical protein
MRVNGGDAIAGRLGVSLVKTAAWDGSEPWNVGPGDRSD